ncbi:MAG: FAD-dependent oxidoreductase, partial [Actinomycetota bacterium]|nr:FAD-dependent oxidoreductase [Actinomycetota bacterium]
VPLRKVLKGAEILNARVLSVDHARKVVRVAPLEGPDYDVPYDVVVIALGSIARTLPIPGLAEEAVGFKTVEEAIYLRNQVLESLDVAESTADEARRKRALTFVFIGGGYAGVEAMAELEDMARFATRYYQRVSVEDLKFVMVEATDHILPEVGEDMGRWTVEQLRKRGIEMALSTRLESCVDGVVKLSNGKTFESDTIVWTAGVKASPVLTETDLPLDEKSRLRAEATLKVVGVENAWGAGDAVAVPDLTKPGEFTAPNAQHAVREARRLGDNIVAVLRGKTPKPYKHKYVGSVASLGLHKGVAQVYGIKLKGFPAWFMHRTYHLSRVPTFNRKVRVVSEWTLALFFKREVVPLGWLAKPFEEFESAAGGGPAHRRSRPDA